jgi:hypothetical protein
MTGATDRGRARRKHAAGVAAFLTTLLVACAGTADEETCGMPPHAQICIGTIDVPSKFRSKFRKGAEESIAAIFSEKFEPALADFIQRHAAVPAIAEPWKGQEAAAIVTAERARYTRAISIVTKGGISGWFSRLFHHNVAYEGVQEPDGSRRIPVNRFGMSQATPGAVANTIAHEVAHAVGLRHPDSERASGLSRAFCEPPYVIGSIVRQIAEGDAWRFNPSFDCHCFAPGATQETCVP